MTRKTSLVPETVELKLDSIQELSQALDRPIDLHLTLDDDALLRTDAAVEARLIYALSLIRLKKFLRNNPQSPAQAEAQAKLALFYIRHVESHSLHVMQFGRQASEAKLAEEIRELRTQVLEAAEQKLQLIADASDA